MNAPAHPTRRGRIRDWLSLAERGWMVVPSWLLSRSFTPPSSSSPPSSQDGTPSAPTLQGERRRRVSRSRNLHRHRPEARENMDRRRPPRRRSLDGERRTLRPLRRGARRPGHALQSKSSSRLAHPRPAVSRPRSSRRSPGNHLDARQQPPPARLRRSRRPAAEEGGGPGGTGRPPEMGTGTGDGIGSGRGGTTFTRRLPATKDGDSSTSSTAPAAWPTSTPCSPRNRN